MSIFVIHNSHEMCIRDRDEAVTLIETTGTYSDTITLPDGGNYIGIECEDFTGNIELNIE